MRTAITAALFMLLFSGSTMAQDCLDYSRMPGVVGACDAPGSHATALSADGTIAYLACSQLGVVAVDVSDPSAPVELGTGPCNDFALGVTVDGPLVYVADRYAGMAILDFTDPSAPEPLGSIALPSTCYEIVVDGGLAWVAEYNNIYCVDVSDPAHPAILSTTPHAYGCYGLALEAGLLYVANANDGLIILDVADPTAPTLAGSLPLPAGAADVVVTGDHAFVAHGSDGIYVVDASTPAYPHLVGALDTIEIGDAVADLVEHFDFVYLATTWGLQVIDVLDKANPTLVNKVGGMDVNGVAFAADRVYCGTRYQGLAVVDVDHPDTTARTGVFTSPGFTANDMIVRGTTGYLGYGGSGVQILDLSDPDAPVQVGLVPTPNSVVNLAFWGEDRIVAVDLSFALHVIDVTDPAAASITGSMPLYDIPTGLAVCDVTDRAYVPVNWYGVFIIDLSDPTAPAEMNEIVDLWQPQQVVVQHPLIWFTDYDHGLQAVDVTDPYAPVRVGGIEAYGSGVAVDAQAGVAYSVYAGLAVYDISDPAAMSLLTEVPLPGDDAAEFVLDGDLLYVAGGRSGLSVFDVSDRTSPSLLGTVFTGDEGRQVAVGAGRAYLCAHFGQLEIALPPCPTATGVGTLPPVANGTLDAHPNPFNPSTSLVFALPQTTAVELNVYDVRGRQMRTLVRGVLDAGRHRAGWDGRDEAGRDVAAGVYFAELRAEAGRSVVKLVLVR